MRDKLVMLIVDDIEVNRSSLKAMFCDEYEILEAIHGEEAMEILHHNKVDVVILDIYMPIMNGADVLERMKADYDLRDIPVIVKTAIDENLELAMLEKGADDFIFSPCEPAVIKNRVRNIVQKCVFRQAMLQQQIKEEQHLSRVRERFISRVSIGMRQDIADIKALCDTGDDMTDTERKRLKKIEFHALNLMEIVEDILNNAQVEHEEYLLRMLPFSLRGVITELTREYIVLCQKKGILLTINNCEIIYDDLIGDEKRLKQLWSCMLKKVYDNTPFGGSISTGYLQRKIGDNRVEIEITVRGNSGSSIEYPVEKSIVELLKGTMHVYDDGDSEYVTVITLPFKIGEKPLMRPKKLGNMRAIVVDDNELTRQYHVSILARLGVASHTAANSANAIDLLGKAYMSGKGYDICLMNWYMLGAKNIIQEMRNIFPKEKMVIACSTNEKKQVEDEMKEAGVDYIVERPVYQEDLYQLLTNICRHGEFLSVEE